MREIKFRAWNKKEKTMEQPVSSYIYEENGLGQENLNEAIGKDFILMQYTGLKDKNGEEIYEGDILENGFKERFVVLWGNGRWIDSTSDKPEQGIWCDLYRGTGGVEEYKKVVGNIYENAELLK